MENRIHKVAQRHYHCAPKTIKNLGGGFYGRVFLVELEEAKQVVFKIYLFKNLAQAEALQIKTLSQYALVKMPKVYFVELDEEGDNDVLAMEFISGVNAGLLEQLPPLYKETLAHEMVDNLLSYHAAINPGGFGKLDDEVFISDWRDYYYPIAENVLKKAQALHRFGTLDVPILKTVETAFRLYSKIFYLPITEARLIHGDYNTWNIMLSPNLQHVEAVIDPFQCSWADCEFDLYQLDNANGKAFNLLSIYKSKRALSENFAVKKAFYELFTEINHFYDANVAPNPHIISVQASNLEKFFASL